MLARDPLLTASFQERNATHRDRERSLIYSHRYEKAKSGNPFALHARDDKRAVVSSEAPFKTLFLEGGSVVRDVWIHAHAPSSTLIVIRRCCLA